MKTLLVCITCLLLSAPAFSQSLDVGDHVPEITLSHVILPGSPHAIIRNVELKNFNNKAIILDFWATWCGPCIGSMPKYEGFQKKYSDQLQVIGITHETVKRIQTFVRNRPVGFMLVVDTASALRRHFEYRSIPHVVLIGKDGTIKAIAHSDDVSDEVISNLIADRAVTLPLKKDKVDFDVETTDYFKADPATRESFNIQPGIPGFGSMSMVGKGTFAKRRVSMFNFTIDGLYRMAYQVSYYRTQLEVDPEIFEYRNDKNKYCVDVIVPVAGDGLYTYMQQQLPRHFDIKARWQKKKMLVTVLKRTAGPLTIKPSSEESDLYSGSSNHFNGDGVTIASLANYLESFGITQMPVVDETALTGRYNIQLEWQPEKKGHYEEVFRNAGFELVKAEREIDVLVLYR